MTTPIVEQIAADIATAIGQITVANGFNQTLTLVRPKRAGFTGDAAPSDGNVLLIQGDPEPDDELSSEGNPGMQAWTQPFTLVAFVIPSEEATAPIDTAINQVRADIEKKLQADPQRGDLAVDTHCVGSVRFADGPELSGVVVAIVVQYRTRRDDPYTAA